MRLTGLDALLAAQFANALFALITTIAFMGLASRLANRDRLVVICAAVVILLQPQTGHSGQLSSAIMAILPSCS